MMTAYEPRPCSSSESSSWLSHPLKGRWGVHVISLGFTGAFLGSAWNLSDPLAMGVWGAAFLVSLFFCFKATNGTFFAAVAGWACLAGYFHYAHTQEAKAFRPIANLSRNAAFANRGSQNEISLAGRVIVWDLQRDKLSSAYYDLPYPLRAKPNDQAITVFLISGVRSEFLWKYHNTSANAPFKIDASGYRDTADFAVVRWPQQQLVAWHSLEGALPDAKIKVTQSHAHDAVHGGWSGTFIRWIQALPGVTEARTAPPHQWTPAEAQAEAARRYPQLVVAGSPLNRAFVDKYQHLKAADSGTLRNPAWPLQIARDLAN